VVYDYGFLLRTFPDLTLRSIDDSCAERAADLRAAYGIRPPDALRIGTAIVSSAGCFVMNDEKLKKVKEIEVITLKDFV
jgi:predicted nucleic acid-binding protein